MYDGVVNGLECKLKIDTGSDISIVNSKFIDSFSKEISVDFPSKYPTGEDVLVRLKQK